MEEVFVMLLTVNFVDSLNRGKQKVVAACNMQIAGVGLNAACAAYTDALNVLLIAGFDGNGAELMAQATKVATQIQPELRVVSVNDDRRVVAAPAYTIIVNLRDRKADIMAT